MFLLIFFPNSSKVSCRFIHGSFQELDPLPFQFLDFILGNLDKNRSIRTLEGCWEDIVRNWDAFEKGKLGKKNLGWNSEETCRDLRIDIRMN